MEASAGLVPRGVEAEGQPGKADRVALERAEFDRPADALAQKFRQVLPQLIELAACHNTQSPMS